MSAIVYTCSQLESLFSGALSKIEVPEKPVIFRVCSMSPYKLGTTIFDSSKSDKPIIYINKTLIGQSEKLVKTVIAHEIAHAHLGLAKGHNREWSALANKYSNLIGGGTVVEKPVLGKSHWEKNHSNTYNSSFLYSFRCKKCGKILGYNNLKECKNLENPIYFHKGCGGSWERIKQGGKIIWKIK